MKWHLKNFGVDFKKIQDQQALSAAQLLELPDDELVMEIETKLDVRYDNAAPEAASLNNSERTAYTAALFDLEVQNGGLCQYLTNSS